MLTGRGKGVSISGSDDLLLGPPNSITKVVSVGEKILFGFPQGKKGIVTKQVSHGKHRLKQYFLG